MSPAPSALRPGRAATVNQSPVQTSGPCHGLSSRSPSVDNLTPAQLYDRAHFWANHNERGHFTRKVETLHPAARTTADQLNCDASLLIRSQPPGLNCDEPPPSQPVSPSFRAKEAPSSGCHAGGTTWAREKKLWDSRDHKKAVLAYWSPDGVNTRSEKLGLDPVKEPDRRTTEDSDVNDGGVADGEDLDLDSDDNPHGDEEDTEGSDKENEYLVEYVGYSPIWLPAHQVCPDAIKNWKGARVPAGGLRPLPGTGNMA
ncbi:hypothetical protein CCHR01_17156 [Colletotrichum chrysophilum]|uniref:Uncharacterized protein n=1 Tax=Colletotrichum chrysophilum TaxID=1836956 RepID=A0AAD9A499_9PEZI|nr:hypothetical protein CCHR01_17156 [Colletotrichum chrysophilum]